MQGHVYIIETIGSISEEAIRKYIENQRENIMIAYKFRVYPDQKQLEVLKQFAGCVRFVYNYMLALSKERYEKEGIKWNTFEYKKLLPKLKEEYPFLKSAPSQALQQAVMFTNSLIYNSPIFSYLFQKGNHF